MQLPLDLTKWQRLQNTGVITNFHIVVKYPYCTLNLQVTKTLQHSINDTEILYNFQMEMSLYSSLGHNNLIICFSDWVEKGDPVDRQAKKKKEDEYH